MIIAPTILDLMEYASDAAAQAAFVTNGLGVSQYPPAQSDTYVKATSTYSTYYPYYTTDPTKSLIGSPVSQCWAGAATTNQRFHMDLGAAYIIVRIYYENYHNSGSATTQGAKNFTFWGSNTAGDFADLVYANDGTWVQIGGAYQMDQHVALNQADPKYIDVPNTVAYRYYAFKFADNWGGATIMAVRRIELRTGLTLQDYSEATIKQEGSYSLKGVATTAGLNKTLTRTVSPVINLTDKTIIKFDIRASRTGSNIKIGIHDSGGTTTEITPNILAADTWQTVVWDISAVANANKDAIDSIIITIVNADAENNFYLDNMFGDVIQNFLIHRGRDRFRTAGYSLGN